uniref:ATP-binding cassette sub-family D member 3 n=1 Tax=Ascaris suum TaxID=6253 RepID=F1KYL7_ASCSU
MPSSLSKLMRPRSALRLKALPAIAGIAAVAAIVHFYTKGHRLKFLQWRRVRRSLVKVVKTKKNTRAHVDLTLICKLWRIWRILIPSIFSAETFYMILIAFSLLCRTYADLWVIMTSTKIEAAIIERNKRVFGEYVLHYLSSMPLISVVNNLLKFGISELKLRFRDRLTKNLYDRYLKGFTFYKMSNLDNRIMNADQLLTQDVEKFSDGIVDLYSNLSKPLVDLALYIFRLGGALGFQAPSRLFIYLVVSGLCLTYLRRPIARLTVIEQQLEGEYRFLNSRLIMNSEEVAFYQGNERERSTILSSFDRLISHLRLLIVFRFSLGFLDNIVAKYCATVVGWYTMSRPFFSKNNKIMVNKSKNELIQQYYNSGRMMFKLAEALGRLALAGREMTRLAGFTTRVDMLIDVLDDLDKGYYRKAMIKGANLKNPNADNSLVHNSIADGASGELIIEDNVIRFEKVPLMTPNGDVLISSLDLEVPSGRNVLVCGPNGCGKSSLFRILGELWPLFGGRLTKPAKGKLFYVPQRPYMTIGTLRDQVIYPDTRNDMINKRISDDQLTLFLKQVQLEYILSREGGWDSVQDWMDVLSGGEKQRIAMARLFYHEPQFAILDECTSAVSMDVEGAIYSLCRERNITLFTVSHRKSLWIHHEYYLHMDGRGNYEFKKINDDTFQFGS